MGFSRNLSFLMFTLLLVVRIGNFNEQTNSYFLTMDTVIDYTNVYERTTYVDKVLTGKIVEVSDTTFTDNHVYDYPSTTYVVEVIAVFKGVEDSRIINIEMLGGKIDSTFFNIDGISFNDSNLPSVGNIYLFSLNNNNTFFYNTDNYLVDIAYKMIPIDLDSYLDSDFVNEISEFIDNGFVLDDSPRFELDGLDGGGGDSNPEDYKDGTSYFEAILLNEHYSVSGGLNPGES